MQHFFRGCTVWKKAAPFSEKAARFWIFHAAIFRTVHGFSKSVQGKKFLSTVLRKPGTLFCSANNVCRSFNNFVETWSVF